MEREIIEAIEELPPIPDIINKLQELYFNDDYTTAEVEEVIKQDPLLVADILKIANSPLYGFPREIIEIRQAIVLFGLEQIIEFALSSFVGNLKEIDLSFYHITTATFLKISHLKTVIARRLIEKGDKHERFLVLNTAFLSDVAKVVLSSYGNKKGLELEEEEMVLNELDEKEKELFGFDTIEVSALIFENWDFSPEMIELLKSFKNRTNPKEEALFISRDIVTIFANIDKERIENLPQKELLKDIK
ncbi:MAG: HDOD domain-containing protein [Epsilonproteobacteria bacterium]|nr:HDOD domain-containing protein [Campylobacterota bacterium]